MHMREHPVFLKQSQNPFLLLSYSAGEAWVVLETIPEFLHYFIKALLWDLESLSSMHLQQDDAIAASQNFNSNLKQEQSDSGIELF